MTREEAIDGLKEAARICHDWGRRRFPIGTPHPIAQLGRCLRWLDEAEAAGDAAMPESKEGESPWRED